MDVSMSDLEDTHFLLYKQTLNLRHLLKHVDLLLPVSDEFREVCL